MASSYTTSTNGANTVSPAEIFETGKAKCAAEDLKLKEAFAMFANAPAVSPTASEIDCAVAADDEADDASNYDGSCGNFSYDMDEDDAACWPAPLNPRRPAAIPAPAEYQDLASKSPYDEEFGDKAQAGGNGTIAGRRGKDGLRIEASAGGIDTYNNHRSTALPTSKHHRRVKSERPVAPDSAREAALRRVLEKMGRQSLALADSVARWERSLEFDFDDPLASPCPPPSSPIYE